MKSIKRFSIFIFLLLLLTNCSDNPAGSGNEINDTSPHSMELITSEEFGAITGTLITEESTDRIGLILYLGQIIKDSNGVNGGFLDPEIAPVAIYDADSGKFVFIDVKPGDYSLIIHEVVIGGKAYMDETGEVKLISVKPGEITDLSEIQFTGF